jgi:hypothetical protein
VQRERRSRREKESRGREGVGGEVVVRGRAGPRGTVGVRGDYSELIDIDFVSALLIHEVRCGHHSIDHVLEPTRRTEQKRSKSASNRSR